MKSNCASSSMLNGLIRYGWLVVIMCLFCVNAFAQEQVIYRLKWLINMSTVGDVFALDHRYFSEQNLEVQIKPGGPERDAIRELELGYADFGVASADQVIRALDKGSPLVVLVQLFQINPLQWIYRSQAIAFDKPEDLTGKTIGVTFGKNDEIIMRTILARAGLDESRVRLFSVRLDYTPFYKGEVDLWPVYINTQGVEIAQKMKDSGEQVSFLKPDQFDVRFVANSIITSRRILEERPQTVRRFVHGLLAGWRASLEPSNATSAMETVRRYDQDTTDAVMRAQLDATRSLVQPDTVTAVGAIDRQAWMQTEKIMLDYKQIQRPVHVEKALMPIVE